jgi:tetratricopeptide (TPR) repeat protein
MHIGLLLSQQGNRAEAETKLREALRLRPEYPEAKTNLASLLIEAKRSAEALPLAEAAVRAKPEHAAMRINLGGALRGLDRHREALDQYLEAIRIGSQTFEALHGAASCRLELNQAEEALVGFERALELKPDYPDALVGKAGSLRSLGRLEESLAVARRAVELQPDPPAWNSLSSTLLDLARFDEAEAAVAAALKIEPNEPTSRFYRAIHRLLRGKLAEGWAEYGWRWNVPGHPRAKLPKPEWDGSPLEGKTILLIAEQGFGDIFQFVRFAKLVKERGAKVILMARAGLREILAGVPGVDRFVVEGEKLPEFDVYAHLLALPNLLKTTLETIPAEIPYLAVEPNHQSTWRTRLKRVSGFKVGVIWLGNPDFRNNVKRSVSPATFAPLTKIPGVSIVSLQKGPAAAEARKAGFVDLGKQYEAGNWLDTAAILSLLELVISVDTGPVHLAGALGVPVWLALNASPDFRWLLDRDDSPWYPSFRLFRQPKVGDWDAVFAEIAEELTAKAKEAT